MSLSRAGRGCGFCLDVDPAVPSALRADPDRLVSFLPMEAVGERGGLDLSREIRAGDALSGYTFVANGDVVLAKVTPCFENGKGAVASGRPTESDSLQPRSTHSVPVPRRMLGSWTSPFSQQSFGSTGQLD